MERSRNKQLAINLAASIIGFVVNIGISFFLTPFIVKSLGAAAFGFVGLSNNIITYTQLVTVALNSMASRYITIKYVEGDTVSANKYFSSVFYSNLLLVAIIGIFLSICIAYLEFVLDVPQELLFDVKLLLSLLSLNYIISLLTNVYSIATFVKNRLDLSSIRTIVSNIFRAIILYLCFALLTPHIWYIGLVGFLVTIYISYTNYKFTRVLTPELVIRKALFEWKKVQELVSSGIWNAISQLGTIIGQGLDLLIANLFIGATAMGVFSISRQIPFYIIAMSGTLASVFAPSLTQLYASKDYEVMNNEISKSIRINGFFIIPPLSFILVFGTDFFSLWIPSQDSQLLHFLTILCGLELVISLPMEILWSVFMVTNKLKVSTLFMLFNHILTFIIVILGVCMFKDTTIQLVILASTRTILGVIRSITFLPIYGASCIKVAPTLFYMSIGKVLLAFLIIVIIILGIRALFIIDTWLLLGTSAIMCFIISTCVFYGIVFTINDRKYAYAKLKKIHLS